MLISTPEREAIVTIGSKEGLANLAQAITAPGDVILVPNPSYPIHQFGFIIADGAVRYVPVTPDRELLSALERAIAHSVPKPIALVLNYPSNPTALVAGLDFYGEIVDFCRRHEIFILSDLAYAEIYFESGPPPSILEVPGAKDVAIEFTSMSKTYSMPGWRIGFAVGNRTLIAALARVKSYLDLWRLHADTGRSRGRLERPAGVCRRHPTDVSRAPRRPDRRPGARRLGRTAAAGDDVRVGTGARAIRKPGKPGLLQAAAERGKGRRLSRRPASASTARAMCASPSSRTSTASVRRRATSASSLPPK